MTYAEVQPLLAELRTNLTNAEVAILFAQDIASDMRYLQRGFDLVRSTACYHRRMGQHPFGGSNRVLPEWRTQIVCHAVLPVRKKRCNVIALEWHHNHGGVGAEDW